MSAILRKLSVCDIDTASILPANVRSVGEMMALLLEFVAGTDKQCDALIDASRLASLRRAVASYVKQTPSNSTEKVQAHVKGKKSKKDGTPSLVWKTLAKGAKVPNGAESRTVTVRSFSAEDINNALNETLPNQYGFTFGILAQRETIDGIEAVHVVFTRNDA